MASAAGACSGDNLDAGESGKGVIGLDNFSVGAESGPMVTVLVTPEATRQAARLPTVMV